MRLPCQMVLLVAAGAANLIEVLAFALLRGKGRNRVTAAKAGCQYQADRGPTGANAPELKSVTVQFWIGVPPSGAMHLDRESPRNEGRFRGCAAQSLFRYSEAMDLSSEKLTPIAHKAQSRCFGCGPANPTGLHLEFLLSEDGGVVCPVTVPVSFEGPAGYVHGGIIATLLDETMSKSVRVLGLTAMTRQMEIDYLRPVHSAAPIRLEGRILRSEGRKHWTEASILDARGHVLARAKALFIEIHSGHGF
jgi:uncharacterized protein (TIGR00369 family)